MTAHLTHRPHWSTACEGEDGNTRPAELNALGEHLQLCAHQKGRWFGLHCAMHETARYAVGHVITSLIGLIALALLLSLAI